MHVLVTGTSSGIGRAIAASLISQGHSVWGVARRGELLASLREELGPRFSYSVADVSQPDAPARLVRELDSAGFVPDAVVLNAGIFPHDTTDGFDVAVSRRVLATNLDGSLSLVACFLDRFLARGSGQFLAVSSIFALRPDPDGVGYTASKAGLTMAFRSLAARYRNTPIRFKTILLGPIATAASAGVGHRRRWTPHVPSPQQAAARICRALLGRRTLICYPAPVGWAMRATAWLSDAAFDALTRPLRR